MIDGIAAMDRFTKLIAPSRTSAASRDDRLVQVEVIEAA